LDYIWHSFSDIYINELIEDALACNPWISKREEPPGPEELKSARRQMLNNRMKWIEQNAG
jgi:hypothetical protein